MSIICADLFNAARKSPSFPSDWDDAKIRRIGTRSRVRPTVPRAQAPEYPGARRRCCPRRQVVGRLARVLSRRVRIGRLELWNVQTPRIAERG